MVICSSWMRSEVVPGVRRHKSLAARSGLSFSPVRAMTRMPRERATLAARSTLGELPEVEIANSTSPGRPRPSTWRLNTWSKPKSLAIADRAEVSVVSASAARPRRGALLNRPVSSAAMCWQSAALPPLPHSSSLPPPRSAAMI